MRPELRFQVKESERILTVTKFCLIVILFSAFLLFFLRIDLWDYDFWWHLATGKYIVTEGHLPDKDPFSFTSAMEENKNAFPEREEFILKQYWLAQSLFYFIYSYFGPSGIIVLRSILLVLTLFIVLQHLQKQGVSFYISFIFIFLLFSVLTKSIGERPVLFTVLFAATVFFLLEDFRIHKTNKIFLLIPIMLFWANLHGGFIIGVIIISVFVLGESLQIILKKRIFSKKETIILYCVIGLAISASFINPMGWNAFVLAFSSKYDVFRQGVQEWQSPFSFYFQKVRPLEHKYIFLLSMFPLILILRNKKLHFTHIILLAGFFYMGVTTERFTVYYAIMSSMILTPEIDIVISGLFRKRLSERTQKRVELCLMIAALCSASLFMIGHLKYDRYRFTIAKYRTVPEAALNFIEKNKLEGRMFNDFGYGGYIAWRLYPYKKNFIDTRGFNIAVMKEYVWIATAKDFPDNIDPSIRKIPLYKRLLNHYRINFVILANFSMYGEAMPLVLKLTESEDWIPVFFDRISIILVKNEDKNSHIIDKYKISKNVIFNSLIYHSAKYALFDTFNPRYLISLGDTFYEMKRLDDALKAYRHALKRMPESSHIKNRIAQLEREVVENK